MPVLISVHVLPPSCVRQKCGFDVVEAQRVRGGVGGERVEVSRLDVEDARPRLDRGGVTFVHVAPPSRRHLDVAVVGARPEDVDVARRRRRAR